MILMLASTWKDNYIFILDVINTTNGTHLFRFVLVLARLKADIDRLFQLPVERSSCTSFPVAKDRTMIHDKSNVEGHSYNLKEAKED